MQSGYYLMADANAYSERMKLIDIKNDKLDWNGAV
jgi:hypothetical protein